MPLDLWLITWGDSSEVWKSKHYRSEQAFNNYWKYHVAFEAWRRSRGFSPQKTLIGYKNGVEIRRYA